MKKDTLEKKQAVSFNNDGFTYKGVKYKGFNLAIVSLLGEIESTLFTKQDLNGSLEYLFVASHDTNTVRDLIDSGEFKKAVLKFSEQFSLAESSVLQELIKAESDKVEAMMVEVRGDSSEKK